MGTDNESAGAAAVGRAMGTEDATPLGYWLALGPRATVQLDEVVTTDRLLPDRTTLSLSGVVTQVGVRDEGARFDSDVFLIEDGVLPAWVAEASQVMTTRPSQRCSFRRCQLGRRAAATEMRPKEGP